MIDINKICHLADVHIFHSKHFHIHDYVFQQFYQQLEIEKPDLCVIAGDIIDSKIKLSPEQIELCRNFLLNISFYCPIIIIPGNHDASLNNLDRIDSLSPIIHSIYYECIHPIHFLKHSDVYTLYGIDWAVWSCFDGQKNPFDFSQSMYMWIKERYTIGLYHGVVNGCVGDNGMMLTGGVNISQFDNVDTVLLGDIHKQQFFRNDEIGFSGSFLQTKQNENIDGSYLIWNWNGKKFIPEVKKINNIFSTISHEIDDISLSNDPIIKDEQQTIIIKYDPHKVSKTDINRYRKELAGKFNNKIEVKPTVKKKPIENVVLTKQELLAFEKLTIQQAFEKYIEKNIPHISDDIKDKLLELDASYGRNIDITRDFEWGDYSLLSIKLSNFMGYPIDETVILFNEQGIYSILGENRCGKTTLFSAIKFCLFNSTPHNSTVLKKLINKHNRTKNCIVECILSKNGKLFSIKRTLIPKKDGVSIGLDFDEINETGDVVRSLKGEKRQDTEKEIQKIFGTENFFEILTSFSAQKRQVEFIDCKNSERLTLVNRFLGLQSFEEKEKEVTSDLKTKKTIYQTYEKEFNRSIDLSVLENELESKQKSILEDKEELQNINLVLTQFIKQNEDFIKQWNKTKITSEKKVDSPGEVEQKINEIEKYLQQLKESIRNKEFTINEYQNILIRDEKKFLIHGSVDIQTWKPNYKFNNELEGKIAVNNAEIKRLKKQIQIDMCGNCGKEFTEKDKKRCEIMILSLENENILFEGEVREKDVAQQILIDMQDQYNSIQRSLSILQSDVLKLTTEITQKNSEKEKYKIQTDEYEEVQDAKKLLLILKDQLDRYNTTKSDIEKNIIQINVSIKGDEERVKNIEKDIITYKTKLSQLQELETEISLLKSYKDIIHKDGLPLFILKNKVEDINEQTNMIINQVFDFDVEFEIDEDAGDLNINFIYPEDAESNDAGLASGSETFLINLAIKTGIAQISDIPKMDSLLIDEGFGTLDDQSRTKIPNLFEAINKYYRNIITISHLDDLKDMADHPIKLKKVGKYTHIIQ